MTGITLVYLIGALCFFLYGLHITEDNLRRAAGERFRQQIGSLTDHRLKGFLFGTLMTVILQSSTATTVMLIGLAGVGYISVSRAIPVVLGADVGTTLLVLILATVFSFRVSVIALTVLVIGFVATFLFRSGREKFLAHAVLGFGFVFYGLSLTAESTIPLRQSALFGEIVNAISGAPVVALAFAAFITALVQSSAAVIGIVIGFVAAGLLSVTDCVPFILGANLGSTAAPLVSGMRSLVEGKRVAFAHAGIKAIGVLALFPLSSVLANGAQNLWDEPSFQVAGVHILFNVILALLFLPVTPRLAAAAEKLIREAPEERPFGPKYLDRHALESPALALANVFREILRAAEIAQDMLRKALGPFDEQGNDAIDELEAMDDQIDVLDREIKFYLAQISATELTSEQSKRQVELLMLTAGIESVGDVITKSMVMLARKKQRTNRSFSSEGWSEIRDFHGKVKENFNLAITSFATNDVELGKRVIRHKRYLATLEQEMGQKHLQRLRDGLRESLETSSIHMDVLSDLRRINSIISKLAYPVLDRESPPA